MLTTKQLVADRFSKAQATYDANALAQKEIAARLSDLIEEVLKHEGTKARKREGNAKGVASCFRAIAPSRFLEIGCGTGLLTRILLSRFAFETVHLNDISDVFAPLFSGLNERYNYHFYAGDAEEMVLDRKYDLIVSSSVFQWFDHVPSFLEKIKQHLSPDGLFAFSTFGPENMREIKALTGSGLAYFSQQEWIELLSPHFQLLQTEESIIEILLDSPKEVLNHIKQTGVNVFKHQITIWTPAKMKQFEKAYQDGFSVGEQVKLTYHPLYFIAKLKK